MPATTASNTIKLSSTTEGIDDFVFNVSGTIRDENKLYEYGFTALPEDWTTEGTWYYSAANGAYTQAWYLSSNARLITPKLTISEGETFFVEAKGYSTSNTSYQHLQMQYSADGTTWTNFDTEPTLNPSEWNTFSFTGVPAGNYYIAINASQANIRMFYGGQLPSEPKMVVTQPASLNFGAITEPTTKTFTIENKGKAKLEGISVTSSNELFTISGAPTELDINESAEVTITMANTAIGNQSSTITVKGDTQNDVTFEVKGAVLPVGLSVIDFNDNKLPENWTNIGSSSYYKWSFSDGAANKPYTSTSNDDSYYMETPKIIVNDGDLIAMNIKRDDSSMARLILKGIDNEGNAVYTNTINGADMEVEYQWIIIDNMPSTIKYIRFAGSYVHIDEIQGINYDMNAPVMDFTAEDFAAGVVTENASKTYTVSNSGTGELTVNIASDNEQFTVSPAQLVITDEAKEFTVTFTHAEGVYGKFEANITVTPTYDETAAVSFKATAQVKNPNVWDEDFEDGSIPSVWVNEGSWTVTTPTASGNNGTKMASISSYNNPKSLITPRLEAKANESLTFYIGMQYDDEPLTIEYSNDEKASWNVIESGVDSYTASGDITFTAPADGYYYLRFTGTYAMLDNFNGFKLALKEHDAIIKAQNVPATGTQYVEYTASVTVEEMAGKAEELTAKFFIGDTQYGEDVTETVEANGTKTFTVTFTTEKPVSGDAYFTVSNAGINLESTKTAVKIAAATVIDEDEINEFEEGRLAAVVLNYAKGAGKWGTIALPFQTTAADLATAFGVSEIKAFGYKSSAENSMTFQPAASTMYAGYVYVIYSDKALNGAKFFDVQVTAPTAKSDGESTKLQATYAPVVDMEGKWGITPDGNIMQGLAGASLKAMRGYITTTEGARLSLIIEDTTSGITTVMEAGDLNEQQAVYNLQGQKMQQAGKGLYIVNGKKMVRK